MQMQLELTACPQCGAPAEVDDLGTSASTGGPVSVVRVACVRRHWFLGERPRLVVAEPGAEPDAQPADQPWVPRPRQP